MVDEVQTEKKPIEVVTQGNNEDIIGNIAESTGKPDKRAVYSEETRAKAIQLMAKGLTYHDIKKLTGIKSNSTISRFLGDKKQVLRKKRSKFMRELIKIGVNEQRIAKKIDYLLDAERLVISGKNEGKTPDNQIQLDTVKYVNDLTGNGLPSQGRQMGIRGENIEVVIKDY